MLRVNITEFTFFSAILNSVYDGWVLPKGRYILRSFRLFICHLQFIFKDNGSFIKMMDVGFGAHAGLHMQVA